MFVAPGFVESLVRMRGTTWAMARRIYFAGSIRAGRDDAHLYEKIVKLLKNYGTVLTEHVGDPKMDKSGSGRPIII